MACVLYFGCMLASWTLVARKGSTVKYCNLSKIRPYGWWTQVAPQRGEPGYFSSCYISLENCYSLALFMYTCSDPAMSLSLSCTCLCKWCLPSFVSPSSCTVLLLRRFLHNRMYCSILNRWANLATTLFKNRGWAYFWGWVYFWEIMIVPRQ